MVGNVPRASRSQCEQGARAKRCQPSCTSMPVDPADVAFRSVYVRASQRGRAPRCGPKRRRVVTEAEADGRRAGAVVGMVVLAPAQTHQ
eukprot:13064622-Alexandrium_andersonii.AAC.1